MADRRSSIGATFVPEDGGVGPASRNAGIALIAAKAEGRDRVRLLQGRSPHAARKRVLRTARQALDAGRVLPCSCRRARPMVARPWTAYGRAHLPLQTTAPGVFAIGDVRSGSAKRVAAGAYAAAWRAGGDLKRASCL